MNSLRTPPLAFAPRVIAITGASRGVGRACALELAGPGVALALMASCASSLAETAALCQAKGAATLSLGFDLSDMSAIDEAAGRIGRELGPVHTLINNAGVWLEAPFERGDMERWESALDVNLKGAMRLTRRALEAMPDGGAVIFIGSSASRKTYAGGANYCAAKHGLLGFAGALFEDVRERGVKVCSLLPGVINTDMHAADPQMDKAKMIQPEDVAAAVAFALAFPANACPTEIAIQPQRYPKKKT